MQQKWGYKIKKTVKKRYTEVEWATYFLTVRLWYKYVSLDTVDFSVVELGSGA
jgi:hypothetical protein